MEADECEEPEPGVLVALRAMWAFSYPSGERFGWQGNHRRKGHESVFWRYSPQIPDWIAANVRRDSLQTLLVGVGCGGIVDLLPGRVAHNPGSPR